MWQTSQWRSHADEQEAGKNPGQELKMATATNAAGARAEGLSVWILLAIV